MSAMTTPTTPAEIDTTLAAKWHERDGIESRIASAHGTILRLAGARYYYRGRRRVTDMSFEEAHEIINATLVQMDEYVASHSTTEDDGYVSTDWSGWSGKIMPYQYRDAKCTFEKLTKAHAELVKVEDEIAELDGLYTGWSRFFLVTSSAGHIHSSMHCSTCRPTTTYGWLPELSGKTEAEAVEAHGPALCSVCFPSAPTEWVGGKITKAQAEKKAA